MKTPEIVANDSWLKPFEGIITKRISKADEKENELTGGNSLGDFAN